MINTNVKKQAITGALIAYLSYSPILTSFTISSAMAQGTQNTTYNYQHDSMGNLTQVTDPLTNITNFSYDPLLRVKQHMQPVPSPGVARPTTNFNYDGLDQPSAVLDPRTLTTTYSSNGLGNQSTVASPDTGTTSRTYDSVGNVLTSTDARGKVTTYTYDALNRVTSIAFTTGAPTMFKYDGEASGAPNAIGRLTRMSDESGQTVYNYDQMGRVLGKVQSSVSAAGTVSRTVGYAYNSNGQLTAMTYPSGNRVIYGYDAAGHISKITLNPAGSNGSTDTGMATALLDQISYAPFGPVLGWVWGNNSEAAPNVYTRTVDLDGRLTTYPLGNLSAATPAVLRTVNYDAASRVTSITHKGNANASLYDQRYAYDGLDRLVTFNDNTGSQTYAYDANGNRTLFTVGTSSFVNTISAASNRLSASTGPYPAKSNQYDAAGNLTADGTTSFTYSDRGRLKSSTGAGGATSYLYNGLGQRVSKTGTLVPTGGNEYVYDERGHLLGEYDASGEVVQETVFLDDLPVAVLKPSTTEGSELGTSVYYVYTDHINTPRVITEASTGNTVWNWTNTDPFGLAGPNENPDGGGVFIYNPRFPGQLFDRETNTHYNYFRDYDPQTGRYVQSDPIGLEGGINTYGYVGGNPISRTDPLGLLDTSAVTLTTRIILQAAPHASTAEIALGPIAAGVAAMCVPGNNGGQCADDPNYFKAECRKQKDEQDCEAIRKQIRELEAQLAQRRGALARDQYNLYNRAYSLGSNPGGDIAKKGTFEGHVNKIVDLQVGVNRLIEKARKMGCL